MSILWVTRSVSARSLSCRMNTSNNSSSSYILSVTITVHWLPICSFPCSSNLFLTEYTLHREYRPYYPHWQHFLVVLLQQLDLCQAFVTLDLTLHTATYVVDSSIHKVSSTSRSYLASMLSLGVITPITAWCLRGLNLLCSKLPIILSGVSFFFLAHYSKN